MSTYVGALFERGLHQFLECERKNIDSGVAERNLCARLAHILEAPKNDFGFAQYYADVEYDRKQGGRIKTIINGMFEVLRITADLILHSRGEVPERDNLLAIEMKKAGRPKAEVVADHERLIAMTKPAKDVWSTDGVTAPEHVSGYELGAFIEINADRHTFLLEYYVGGECVHQSTNAF